MKPEEIAFGLARETAGPIVLDAFCGVGGSAIGFARAGKTVIATDIDESRLLMAKHNAALYGYTSAISFSSMPAQQAVEDLHYDSLYLDPPWGGPDYINREFFSFESFAPNPKPLINTGLERGKEVVITVPLNFDFREISEFQVDHRVTWSCLESQKIFATVFMAASNSLRNHL